MNWVDYAVLAIIALSALVSLLRGFAREVLSLVTWIISFWVALNFSPRLAQLFAADIPVSPLRLALAFGLLFIITLVVGALVSRLVGALMRHSPLNGPDRILGMVFGTLRGVLIVAVLVTLIGITPAARFPLWQQSVLVDKVKGVVLWGKALLPNGLAQTFIDGLKSKSGF